MINRLAVILTGQYRTWPVCSKYLLKFFKSKANHVDYYFVTWNTTSTWYQDHYDEPSITVRDKDITNYFDGNLIYYSIEKDIPQKNTYYRMAHLSNIAGQAKRQYEESQNFVYDQVVETRTDIYLRDYPKDSIYHLPLTVLENYQYSGGRIENYDVHKLSLIEPTLFVPDLYIRTNSFTHNLLSNRIHHFDMRYAKKNFFDNTETVYLYPHHAWLAGFLIFQGIYRWDVPYKDFEHDCAIRDTWLTELDLDTVDMDLIYKVNLRLK
jgi:hypothetical protein